MIEDQIQSNLCLCIFVWLVMVFSQSCNLYKKNCLSLSNQRLGQITVSNQIFHYTRYITPKRVHDNWPRPTDSEQTDCEPNDADWLRRPVIQIFYYSQSLFVLTLPLWWNHCNKTLVRGQFVAVSWLGSPKRVTNWWGPFPHYCACGQHSSFRRNVAAMARR